MDCRRSWQSIWWSAAKLMLLSAILQFAFGSMIDSVLAEPTRQLIPDYCKHAEPASLPLPSTLPSHDYQQQLYAFLAGRRYEDLGWCVDKTINNNHIRETGAFINNTYYGTHPAVRVYYSPEVVEWLVGDRGRPIPDGAMIVKEMFKPPAARYAGFDNREVLEHLEAWSVMVREASGSHDGWYWANPGKSALSPDSDDPPFTAQNSGFGQYCLRCHASAQHNSTFSTLRNIEGFAGEPIKFRIDDSWRDLSAHEKPWQPQDFTQFQQLVYQHMPASEQSALGQGETTKPKTQPANQEFLELFKLDDADAGGEILKLPGETVDRIFSSATGPQSFLSSDQCMMCHGGISGNKNTASGPVMFLQTGPTYGKGYNVSPYGEWRWSPMGLAGRDPIFHAQLDSEIKLLKKDFASEPAKADTLVNHVVNICLTCHAAMGQRELASGAAKPGADPMFKRDYLYLGSKERTHTHHRYGALGRDGISCTVCHRMVPPEPHPETSDLKNYLTNAITGNFSIGKPDEVFGPFKDDEIVTLPMKNALGVTPKHSPYIQGSRLCGSCHTVNLPNVDQPLKPGEATMLDAGQENPLFKNFKHTIEQATYLEWLNSAYQNEFPSKNPTPQHMKTCQGCHMPEGFKSLDGQVDIKQLQTRIAAIQDDTYPEADHVAPTKDIHVRFRKSGFRRHRFQGLNAFLIQMFSQASEILGVRKVDFMTGARGLEQAMESYIQQARERTVDLALSASQAEAGQLTATVRVTNKTGHRFPSGVGFRRAFLELLVIDKSSGHVLWGSGRTNSVGAIVDQHGKILPTEFFERDAVGNQQYQQHHEVIRRQNQVQIYEELIKSAKGEFTTSFIHRYEHVKDNRLLPLGWREKGHDAARYQELKDFVHATHPDHVAAHDDDYRDGRGGDAVVYKIMLPDGVNPSNLKIRASIYYQSIPPSWLRQRFETAPDMPATQRLHHIASRLKLDGTPLENWKFKLVSAEASVDAGQ
jgi:Cytochrome P460